MKGCSLLFMLYISSIGYAQKPAIDTGMLGKWPALNEASIRLSNNGKFVTYSIDNLPKESHTLITQTTDSIWKKEFIAAGPANITEDSKWVIFTTGDSLCRLLLGTDSMMYIPHFLTWSLIELSTGPMLLYSLKTEKNELILYEMSTGKKEIFKNHYSHILIPEQRSMLLQQHSDDSTLTLQLIKLENPLRKTIHDIGHDVAINLMYNPQASVFTYTTQEKENDSICYYLHWNTFGLDKDKVIYKSKSPVTNLHFDHKGNRLLFYSENKIAYYDSSLPQACIKISETTQGIPKNLTLTPSWNLFFSKDGNLIFFKLQEKEVLTKDPTEPKLIIWNNQDEYLKTTKSAYAKPYQFIYNLQKDTIFRLEQEGESGLLSLTEESTKQALLAKNQDIEWWWRPQQRGYVSLVSLQDGSRNGFNKLFLHSDREDIYELSPDGKYFVYYDPILCNFFSVETASGKSFNITKNIKTSWVQKNNNPLPTPTSGPASRPIGIAGWLQKNELVLLYSQFDIWQIDLTGKSAPINLTEGYGSTHHIRFSVSDWVYEPKNDITNNSPSPSAFILQGIDIETFEVGLYSKEFAPASKLKLLVKGAFTPGSGLFTMKSGKADTWIMVKSTYNKAPNISATTNWKKFTTITNIQPQNKYNWYIPELIKWRLPDGTICKGILYKPENMDTIKKYPIIFTYYEDIGYGLNYYQKPNWTNGSVINIPYFVSNGYIVCIPDIHIKIGYPGASALNTVLSVAAYLTKRPYIDSHKMGLAGHSYGGFETNYIVTYSHLFAAASEGAGMTDLISKYGWINAEGISNQWDHEISQTRIGATLWKKPDLYINNSPIFRIDKVTTPLLILHNKLDDSVPWQQGVEWFTGLRRLGKKAWMLQYEGEGHSVSNFKNCKDYTLKLKGFFDYYLKNSALPAWMKN